MANINVKWNSNLKHYEIVVGEKLEKETVYIDGKPVDVIRCPYCGEFHDCTQVDDSKADLYGLSVFCCNDCADAAVDNLGKFCECCGCFIPDGDEHNITRYADYCENCALEAQEDDEYAEETNRENQSRWNER